MFRTALAFSVVLAATVLSGADAASNPPAVGVAPIKAVILVDESGSLSATDVAAERNAAALLAESELSAESRFSIAGFGSSNAPGQNAVQTYCGFTTLDSAAAREQVASCASKIHKRAPAQGNDTDHAAALGSALSELESNRSVGTPVIFLLTDGVLDVSHSPQYGKTATARNAEARREIRDDILPRARHDGIAIWPLGFGAASKAGLSSFASGGGGANSGCAGSKLAKPHAVIVGSSADLVIGLLRTLGAARCAEVNQPSSGRLKPGKTLILHVTIPVVATDGAITVAKVDKAFRVAYFDPTGQEASASGTVAGQTFDLSGQANEAEALRIRDPRPGRWTVKVTAPTGSSAQLVTATAVWEGALEGAVTLVPAEPVPGQTNTVEVVLKTRTGLINNPRALRGIHAEAFLSSKATGRVGIPLRDDGKGGDRRAHDGVFTGRFLVPKGVSGSCAVVGVVSGAGLASDRRPYGCRFWAPGVPTAEFTGFNVPGSMHPGGTATGKITINNEQAAQHGSIVLSGLSAGALVTVTPSRLQLPHGTEEFPFRLQVDRNMSTKQIAGQIQVLDDAGIVIGEAPFFTNISAPPSLFSRFWWVFVVIGLILLGTVVGLRLRAAARKRDARVTGLSARLMKDDEVISVLNAPVVGAEFPIEVVDDPDNPRLRPVANGSATITIRRARGAVSVEGPNQPQQFFELEQQIPLNGQLTLAVSDSRRASSEAPLSPTEELVQTQGKTGGEYIASDDQRVLEKDDLL